MARADRASTTTRRPWPRWAANFALFIALSLLWCALMLALRACGEGPPRPRVSPIPTMPERVLAASRHG